MPLRRLANQSFIILITNLLLTAATNGGITVRQRQD